MTRKKQCTCPSCKFIRKVQTVQKKLSPRDAEVIEDLLLRWEAESTDASHSKAVLEGKWPNSLDILKHAVSKLGYKVVYNKPVAWRREWDGDDSDTGNMLVELDDGTGPPQDNHEWDPLYSEHPE